MKNLAIGQFVWREITRNHYVSDLGHGIDIAVLRSPRWRSLGQTKPWRVELFGNHFSVQQEYARLQDAQYMAEREAVDRLCRVAEMMGMSYPSTEDVRRQVQRARAAQKPQPKKRRRA